MIDETTLNSVGMTENESKIYLILLSLKEAKASAVALKTKISRPHVYDSLNKLIEKGFASYIIKNGNRFFMPANPEKLLDNLKEKEKILESSLEKLKEMCKPLQKKANIEIFEGGEGIKTILNHTLKVKEEILAFNTLGKEFLKYIPEHFLELYFNQRAKLKIKSRQFYTEESKVLKNKMAQYKKIPREFNPVSLFVYGNNVVMFILTESPLTIKIESEEVAKLYKNQFELLWKTIR